MGEEVSAEQNTYENPTKPDVYIDLKHEFNIHYRLLRKRWSAFIRKQLQKNFANILYITIEKPSFEFILSLQRQYPDKVIKLLVPLLGEVKDFEKTSINFDYFLQNQKFTASVYKIPSEQDNLQIFGISTNAFDELNDYLDIYNLKYLVHFVKLARKAALKIKPDIIHADNIPLLAGIEFGK